MKSFLFFAALVCHANLLSSYPIAPQTLGNLISQADLIVIATVRNPDLPGESGEVATLQIMEVLKGVPHPTASVRVFCLPNMICPAPPRYPDKSVVIAFLKLKTSSVIYDTQGLSYGAKVMANESQSELYRTRILEYLDISLLPGPEEKKAATTEWLVRCAEHPYTRWDGAFELRWGAAYAPFFENPEADSFLNFLSGEQLRRIDSAFFDVDTIASAELAMMDLIAKDRFSYLRAFLLRRLPVCGENIVPRVMEKIIEIAPDDQLSMLLEEFLTPLPENSSPGIHREALIRKFIDRAEGRW